MIVIIDHQLLVLSLLSDVLLSKLADFDVLALSTTDELGRLGERNLKLVILRPPENCNADPLAHCDEIAKALAGVPILLLSDRNDLGLASEALARGYSGILSNGTPVGILLAAVQLVLAGGSYFPVAAVSKGHEDEHDHAVSRASTQLMAAAPNGLEAAFGLTLRELEVLAQLREGHPNKQIARDLSISENTAKMHVRRIFAKLRVKNRIEAILMLQSCFEGAHISIPRIASNGMAGPDRAK